MSRRIRGVDVKGNLIDRAVEFFDPVRGAQRLRARAMMAVAGSWLGGRSDRRATKNWTPKNGSADADLLWDLPTLRDRSRDALRNNPLALGAVNTAVTATIGTGLSLNAAPDAKVLGWSDEQAEEWAAGVEAEFCAWAGNPQACDAAKTLDFYRMQRLAFRSCLEAGDVFALLPMVRAVGQVYETRVHMVEADRVCNKDRAIDTDRQAGGVQKGEYGEPLAYHILRQHPGGYNPSRFEWDVVPAFGERTGRRNVVHLFEPARINQSRGYPYLAPVIEPLKQLQTYTEAEITAAVVSGMFTVFVKTEGGEGLDTGAGNTTAAAGGDINMGAGAIVDLAAGEDVQFANPGRPNQAFDPFVQAILRQIGVALEIPFELLVKHFTASYSAARAALLEAWRFFKGRRAFMAAGFCQPIYEAWFEEAVALGRIAAPGFFSDPVLRAAYLGAEWIGDAPGQIDPEKEINAAAKRIEAGLSNHSIETMALHGMPWEGVQKRLAKEMAQRKADGTLPEPAPARGMQGQGGEDDEGGEQRRPPPRGVSVGLVLPDTFSEKVVLRGVDQLAAAVQAAQAEQRAATAATGELVREATQMAADAVAQSKAVAAQIPAVIAAVKAKRVTTKEVLARDAAGKIKTVRQTEETPEQG